LVEALGVARAYVDSRPTDPKGWLLVAKILQLSQRNDEALTCLEQAVERLPNQPDLLVDYGLSLIASGRRSDALSIASRVEFQTLTTAELNTARGMLFSLCEEPQRALPSFVAALSQRQNSCECLYNYASAQRMLGDLLGAEQSLNRALALNPNHGPSHLMRSDLRHQTEASNHIAALLLALRLPGTRENCIALKFALVKELEDLGRFEESFTALELACRMQRRRMTYDVMQDVATIEQIIQTQTGTEIGGSTGFPTEEPIFVFGLPRSGTTLIAEILASHSEVTSIGESPAFAAEAIRAVRENTGRQVGKSEFVTRVLELNPGILGAAYIAATRPQSGRTLKFVDKTPINYLYAGIIARSLPMAKIVAVARDPMDVCFAMFKTLFTGAYPFSYDLCELGEYYAAWHRLMLHWKAVLGGRLLVVQYEDLVANQVRVTRRILEHCGLEWQESCLEFGKGTRAITTASASQVRRGLYSSSVGKSARYSCFLKGLQNKLELHGVLGAKLDSGAAPFSTGHSCIARG
jgi:tetratricopeptide (TPR) repeat protein